MLEELIKYVLPKELVDNLELIDIKTDGDALHFYMDEKNMEPPEYTHLGLSGNGFYESSTIKDFPLRDKKTLLHVRCRRWIDDSGRSLFPELGFSSLRGHAIQMNWHLF